MMTMKEKIMNAKMNNIHLFYNHSSQTSKSYNILSRPLSPLPYDILLLFITEMQIYIILHHGLLLFSSVFLSQTNENLFDCCIP